MKSPCNYKKKQYTGNKYLFIHSIAMLDNQMNDKNGASMAVEHGEHHVMKQPMDGKGMAEEGVNVRTEPNANDNHYSD